MATKLFSVAFNSYGRRPFHLFILKDNFFNSIKTRLLPGHQQCPSLPPPSMPERSSNGPVEPISDKNLKLYNKFMSNGRFLDALQLLARPSLKNHSLMFEHCLTHILSSLGPTLFCRLFIIAHLRCFPALKTSLSCNEDTKECDASHELLLRRLEVLLPLTLNTFYYKLGADLYHANLQGLLNEYLLFLASLATVEYPRNYRKCLDALKNLQLPRVLATQSLNHAIAPLDYIEPKMIVVGDLGELALSYQLFFEAAAKRGLIDELVFPCLKHLVLNKRCYYFHFRVAFIALVSVKRIEEALSLLSFFDSLDKSRDLMSGIGGDLPMSTFYIPLEHMNPIFNGSSWSRLTQVAEPVCSEELEVEKALLRCLVLQGHRPASELLLSRIFSKYPPSSLPPTVLLLNVIFCLKFSQTFMDCAAILLYKCKTSRNLEFYEICFYALSNLLGSTCLGELTPVLESVLFHDPELSARNLSFHLHSSSIDPFGYHVRHQSSVYMPIADSFVFDKLPVSFQLLLRALFQSSLALSPMIIKAVLLALNRQKEFRAFLRVFKWFYRSRPTFFDTETQLLHFAFSCALKVGDHAYIMYLYRSITANVKFADSKTMKDVLADIRQSREFGVANEVASRRIGEHRPSDDEHIADSIFR